MPYLSIIGWYKSHCDSHTFRCCNTLENFHLAKMRYISLLSIAGVTGLVLAAPGPSLSKRAGSFVCMKCTNREANYISDQVVDRVRRQRSWRRVWEWQHSRGTRNRLYLAVDLNDSNPARCRDEFIPHSLRDGAVGSRNSDVEYGCDLPGFIEKCTYLYPVGVNDTNFATDCQLCHVHRWICRY